MEQFKSIEGEIINDRFIKIHFNGVDIIMNHERTMFNASKIVSELVSRRKENSNLCTKTFNDWFKTKQAKRLQQYHPEWFEHVGGKGSRTFGGYYLSMDNLFREFCNSMAGEKSIMWLNGDENWELTDEGYVYLVQTASHIGSDIYKVGYTWNTKQRFIAYGKNVDVIAVEKVNDMNAAEKILIKMFSDSFNRAIKDKNNNGEEYFHVPTRDEAINRFYEGISLYSDLYE